MKHYSHSEDRYGGVEILHPDGRSVYLQGDDASEALVEIAQIERIWTRGYGPSGAARKKPFGPFESLEEQFDALYTNLKGGK